MTADEADARPKSMVKIAGTARGGGDKPWVSGPERLSVTYPRYGASSLRQIPAITSFERTSTSVTVFRLVWRTQIEWIRVQLTLQKVQAPPAAQKLAALRSHSAVNQHLNPCHHHSKCAAICELFPPP